MREETFNRIYERKDVRQEIYKREVRQETLDGRLETEDMRRETGDVRQKT